MALLESSLASKAQVGLRNVKGATNEFLASKAQLDAFMFMRWCIAIVAIHVLMSQQSGVDAYAS